MRTKWVQTGIACALLLAILVTGARQPAVRAQGGSTFYLPVVYKPQRVWFDNFSDNDPAWPLVFIDEVKDGYFEHLNGYLAGHIRDNSGIMVTSPGWQSYGAFSLEVDGRHTGPLNSSGDPIKTFNGLGLAFGGNDDWSDYYVLMLASGGAQHAYAIIHYVGVNATILTNGGRYRGGDPTVVNSWARTNRLMVAVRDGTIKAYCNGKELPSGIVNGVSFAGSNVGLIVTSYEFDEGEVQFDNFQLTQSDVPQY